MFIHQLGASRGDGEVPGKAAWQWVETHAGCPRAPSSSVRQGHHLHPSLPEVRRGSGEITDVGELWESTKRPTSELVLLFSRTGTEAGPALFYVSLTGTP